VKWRRALIRWASAYQFLLLSGYTAYVDSERQDLEDKVNLAERRSQDFSAQLGDAYEKERRRLAQDLHDEIGHDLIVLKLYTEVIALELKKGEIPQVRKKLREAISLIKHALKGVRHLVFDLGPAVWSEQGFLSALRLYLSQYADRTGLKVRFSARGLKVELPARYETALYKALQGALSNVAAHANAEHVQIVLSSNAASVVMKIADDGKGFNVGRKLRSQPHSFGLRAMRDRIELLGGSIHFMSQPGTRGAARRGTVIEFQLPLHDVQSV
jgi:signal transduction histidine kinase